MATLSFILTKKSEKQTPLFGRVNHKGKQKNFGLDIQANTKNWDSRKQRFKKSKVLSNSELRANKKLQDLEDVFQNVLDLGLDEIVRCLKLCVQGVENENVTTLVQAYDDIIEKGHPEIKTKGTLKNYKATLEKVKLYEKAKGLVYLKDIDKAWGESFMIWLHDDGISDNTITKHLKNIKSVMSKAYDKGYHDNNSIKSLKLSWFHVHNIALTPEELKRLSDFKLEGQDELIRDFFLIGCYLGLRYSDFDKVQLEAIKNGSFTYYSQKTKGYVVLPVSSKCLDIINKYGVMPKVPSDVILNRRLKVIAKKAKINDVEVVGEGQTDLRYNLIKTHTARRTFATNAYKSGVPLLAIMKFTGHKTEANLLRYIKVSGHENAENLKNHPFFK